LVRGDQPTFAGPILPPHCPGSAVAELLEKVVGRRETEWEVYFGLLKQQRAESGSLASLATKLRLKPQSRRNDRGNPRPAVARTGPAPWEPAALE
jgi:hypothetical protein